MTWGLHEYAGRVRKDQRALNSLEPRSNKNLRYQLVHTSVYSPTPVNMRGGGEGIKSADQREESDDGRMQRAAHCKGTKTDKMPCTKWASERV